MVRPVLVRLREETKPAAAPEADELPLNPSR
jgi:hypothetical protein